MKFQFWRHYHDLATIVSAAATAQRYSVLWCLRLGICGYSFLRLQLVFVCKQCRSYVTAAAQSKPQSPLL